MHFSTPLITKDVWSQALQQLRDMCVQDNFGLTAQEYEDPQAPKAGFLSSLAEWAGWLAHLREQGRLKGTRAVRLPAGELRLDLSILQATRLQVQLASGAWAPAGAFLQKSLFLPALELALYRVTGSSQAFGQLCQAPDELSWARVEVAAQVLQLRGGYQLQDLYLRFENRFGFYAWSPDYLAHDTHATSHRVDVLSPHQKAMLTLHEEPAGPSGVRFVEWQLQLIEFGWPSRNSPDSVVAAVSGMVCLLPREGGKTLLDVPQVQQAGAELCPQDEALVRDFLSNHPNPQELLEAADVCFVDRWERAVFTSEGTGALALKIAVRMLRREFPALHAFLGMVAPLDMLPSRGCAEPQWVAQTREEATRAVAQLFSDVMTQELQSCALDQPWEVCVYQAEAEAPFEPQDVLPDDCA